MCTCENRIGTEHEKFGFEVGTLRPINYDQIAELLNGLAERFGWDQVMEGDYIIGLKQVIKDSLGGLLLTVYTYVNLFPKSEASSFLLHRV